MKKNWAKFKSEKEAKKAYRLLSKLFHLNFQEMIVAIGFDQDKKLVWLRWDKQLKKVR